MRSRTLSEIVRDTHVGSIVLAELIAAGLGALQRAVENPALWAVSSVINWVSLQAVHDQAVPDWILNCVPSIGWILDAALLFGAAYLIAVWIYTPKKRAPRNRTFMTQPSPNWTRAGSMTSWSNRNIGSVFATR